MYACNRVAKQRVHHALASETVTVVSTQAINLTMMLEAESRRCRLVIAFFVTSVANVAAALPDFLIMHVNSSSVHWVQRSVLLAVTHINSKMLYM
jgi:hypothetical protein